jgi:hypothetical protein
MPAPLFQTAFVGYGGIRIRYGYRQGESMFRFSIDCCKRKCVCEACFWWCLPCAQS